MALNPGVASVGGGGSGLSQEMATAILAVVGSLGTPPGSIVAEQQVVDLANAISQTVIAHFIANAQLSTTVAAGILVSTTGSATAQTGSTTSVGAGTGTAPGALF